MTTRDWVDLGKGIVCVAALGLANLYFLEWRGSLNLAGLRKAHHEIWKRPNRWQRITVCALWGFIIVAFALLVGLNRQR